MQNAAIGAHHMGLGECPKSWLLMNALCEMQLSGLAIWFSKMPKKQASDECLMQSASLEARHMDPTLRPKYYFL